MAKAKLVEARVLVEIASLGVTCDHVVRGTTTEIKALVVAGQADSEPAAVEYAKSIGSEVVSTLAALEADQADAAAAQAATDAKAIADAQAMAGAQADADAKPAIDAQTALNVETKPDARAEGDTQATAGAQVAA